MKQLVLLLAGTAALVLAAVPGPAEDDDWGHNNRIKHVLLISIMALLSTIAIARVA